MPPAADQAHTYLFTDLVDSTTHLARGDVEMTEAMSAMAGHMERAEVQWKAVSPVFTGDGFMVAFPSADDALEFATEVMAWARNPRIDHTEIKPVGVRIGLHTGTPDRVLPVSHIGLAPSLASRVCDAAHPNQILLSGATEDVVSAVPAGYELTRLGSYQLPGDVRGTDLWSLVGDGLTRAAAPAGDLRTVGDTPAWWQVQDRDELDLVIAELEAIAGITPAKNEIIDFLERAALAIDTGSGPLPLPLDMDMVFIGPRGTGKSLVARLLASALVHLGVLSRPDVVSLDAVEFGRRDSAEAVDVLAKARGALVVITNADHLAVLVDADPRAAALYAGPFLQLADTLHRQRQVGLTSRLQAHERLFVVLPLRDHQNFERLRRWGAGVDELYGGRVVFEPLDNDELVQAFQRHARIAGFAVDASARQALERVVSDPTRGLDCARAMGWLFDQARLNFELRHARAAAASERVDAGPRPQLLTASDIVGTPTALA